MNTLLELSQDQKTNTIALREDGTIDLNATAKTLLEDLLNTVMDEQARELGVPRNGYRHRSLDTALGKITLKIPKLRSGSYFPDDIVSRWSRTDTALASAICEMWVSGISTRKVEKALSELGVEQLSKSRVSRLAESLDFEVDQLRRENLSYTSWPYLWLDGTTVNCRDEGRVRQKVLVTAVALNSDGARRIVGIEGVDVESYISWRSFLLSLRKRGLLGVELVISDDHQGLVQAIKEVFNGCSWQRCIAHFERNVRDTYTRKNNGQAALAAIKQAFKQTNPALVRAGYERAIELVSEVDKKSAKLLEGAEAEVLTYLDFPLEHHRWIRTNNVQERMNEEIKRRIKVVVVFPSVESAIRLVGAVCCDQNDAWLSGRGFIDKETLQDDYEHQVMPDPQIGERIEAMRLIQEAFDNKRKAA
jgi:putative transposase